MITDAQAFEAWLKEWPRRTEAAGIVGVWPTNMYGAAKTHRIATQKLDGVTRYFRADCERARQERVRKAQTEPEVAK
jgi:hypothetical protein